MQDAQWKAELARTNRYQYSVKLKRLVQNPRGTLGHYTYEGVHPIFSVNFFLLSMILLGQEKIISKSGISGLKLKKKSSVKTIFRILAKFGAIL